MTSSSAEARAARCFPRGGETQLGKALNFEDWLFNSFIAGRTVCFAGVFSLSFPHRSSFTPSSVVRVDLL